MALSNDRSDRVNLPQLPVAQSRRIPSVTESCPIFSEPWAGETAWTNPTTSDGQRLWNSGRFLAAKEMNHRAG